jgi:hypothetical protein
MNISIDRDDFADDLFPREPRQRYSVPYTSVKGYVPIWSLEAGLVSLSYIFTKMKNIIKNRVHGPSLLDQIGETLFPRL